MKEVAAAIAIRDGRVLLARRAAGQNLAGYWEFPGGKKEPNETIEACMTREILEELGVTARAGRIFADSTYTYPGGEIHLYGIEVELADEPLQLRVHDAVQWVKIERILELKLAPADIPIAVKLQERFPTAAS